MHDPDPVPFLRPPPKPREKRRFRVHLSWLIPLLIVATVLSWGYVPTATGPASGNSLAGSAVRATTRPTLRIATFNIHSGRNAAGDFNLERTAALMKGYDLIGLNEVRGAGTFGEVDQAELLGRKLKMQSLFAPTERRWWSDDFGNGLLSAVSVADWKRTPLPGTSGRGKRNILHVRVMLQGQPVNILITHIDRQADRANQMTLLGDQFLSLSPPAVCMGDFNTQRNQPELQRLLNAPGVIDAAGQGAEDRIDWILVRGLEVVASGIEKNDASDHPLVWAELKLSDRVKTK
jgi:endonuclease/exonuclease/phosphatase family metal-dependent hydrolase